MDDVDQPLGQLRCMHALRDQLCLPGTHLAGFGDHRATGSQCGSRLVEKVNDVGVPRGGAQAGGNLFQSSGYFSSGEF